MPLLRNVLICTPCNTVLYGLYTYLLTSAFDDTLSSRFRQMQLGRGEENELSCAKEYRRKDYYHTIPVINIALIIIVFTTDNAADSLFASVRHYKKKPQKNQTKKLKNKNKTKQVCTYFDGIFKIGRT